MTTLVVNVVEAEVLMEPCQDGALHFFGGLPATVSRLIFEFDDPEALRKYLLKVDDVPSLKNLEHDLSTIVHRKCSISVRDISYPFYTHERIAWWPEWD